MATGPWLVVGAGYAGLPAAAALLQAGLDVELLDAGDGVGGAWRGGVYDSVRLVTSREGTAYPGYPFPSGTPLFPRGPDMLAYLRAYAGDTGVDAVLRPGTTVHRVLPESPDGTAGWRAETDAGVRRGAGVVLATGRHAVAHVPDLPGRFDGHALHTRDYRRPADLLGPAQQAGSAGPRTVLVVGAGNSGADVALEAADAGHRVLLAVRRGLHVVPKALFGRAASDLVPSLLLPEAVTARVAGGVLRALRGRTGDYGLPEPERHLLAEPPVLHSGLLPALRAGRVTVVPAPVRLDGDGVVLDGGRREHVDTLVWATGYLRSLPVDRVLVDGAASGPERWLLGLVSPVTAGLLTTGLLVPRSGAGRLHARAADLLAQVALTQGRIAEPVGPLLARFVAPSTTTYADERRVLSAHRRARSALPAVERRAARSVADRSPASPSSAASTEETVSATSDADRPRSGEIPRSV